MSEQRQPTDIQFAIDQFAIVATTDVRGTITSVNQKFCEISKYSREELIGQNHRLLNSGHHPPEFFRHLWATIAGGQVWRGEILNRAKDCTLYWVDTAIVPFLDADGRPYQYMAIRYEISDRKRSEGRLREQEALTRLGEMAAVVAHEVKNPIAAIRGALQVISGRMPAEQSDRMVLSDVIARLDALNLIVDDLLLYARPRAPKREAIDVSQLVDVTIAALQRDPVFTNVSVTMHGSGETILGDAEQLRIVLQNLLLNAAQAMKGDGAIEITLTGDATGSTIRVHDRGPGIPDHILSKAFEPFVTTKHRGTGLGLAIVKRIVDAHGGRVALALHHEAGTVATVWLPVIPSAPA